MAAACCAVFDGVIVVSCCESLAGGVVIGGGDLDRFCGRVPVDIVVVVVGSSFSSWISRG